MIFSDLLNQIVQNIQKDNVIVRYHKEDSIIYFSWSGNAQGWLMTLQTIMYIKIWEIIIPR